MTIWQARARRFFFIGVSIGLLELALIAFDLLTGHWPFAIPVAVCIVFVGFAMRANWRQWHT